MFGKCFVPFNAKTTTDKNIFCPVLSVISIRYSVTRALPKHWMSLVGELLVQWVRGMLLLFPKGDKQGQGPLVHWLKLPALKLHVDREQVRNAFSAWSKDCTITMLYSRTLDRSHSRPLDTRGSQLVAQSTSFSCRKKSRPANVSHNQRGVQC